MPLPDFRCVNRFRVPYCAVYMLHHVNHAAYIVWAETVRCEYFTEVLKEPLNGTNGMILASLQFEYAQPLDYREEVAVACRISRLGRKSFDFSYEIWSETRRLLAAHGTSTMVAFDYKSPPSLFVPHRGGEAVIGFEVVAPT